MKTILVDELSSIEVTEMTSDPEKVSYRHLLYFSTPGPQLDTAKVSRFITLIGVAAPISTSAAVMHSMVLGATIVDEAHRKLVGVMRVYWVVYVKLDPVEEVKNLSSGPIPSTVA